MLKAIAIYQEQHSEINNWQQIVTSLSEKIILLPPQNSSWALVYRCAIAFPLANLAKLSPLLIARQLVSLLPSKTEKTLVEEGLEVAVAVAKSGWIDFSVCDRKISEQHQKRNLIIWLDRLVVGMSAQSHQKMLHLSIKKGKRSTKLFPLQYIYGRCNSLLQLGEREGLIILETENFRDLRWQIKQPSPLKWIDDRGNLCLFCPQAKDLLWQICLIMDYLADTKEYSLEHWKKFTYQMSEVWLNFMANCGFCGEIQQHNPSLAIARLGLISLTHWCLQAILMSQLNIIPQKEI
ncbi:conserved hypothetical protein [Hyella patelloides LEGE 07179]|uniref:DALR anticodon binding domain-containing protein n=2 Tax=Hyella TaxID=945733 RepID=A0A563VZU5_9CYAN|nr:conserved hypothetical protein [Hyella patelloides LEGE 07179]